MSGNLSPLLFSGKRFSEVSFDVFICLLSSLISKSEKNLDRIPHPAFDAPPNIQLSRNLCVVIPSPLIGVLIIFFTTMVVPRTVRPSSFPNPAAKKAAFESVVPEINSIFLFKLNFSAIPESIWPIIFPLLIIRGKQFSKDLLR